MSRAEQQMVDTIVRTEDPIFETDSGLRAHYVNGTVLLLTMTHHGWEAWDTYSDLSACVEAIADCGNSNRKPSIYQGPVPEGMPTIAPALLWIITEMLRPPAGKNDYIPRQTTQFRDYAQTVVNQASVCMTADGTGWEKYLGQ